MWIISVAVLLVGGALGAALAIWHLGFQNPRPANRKIDSMQGAYLGPSFSDLDIEAYLKWNGFPFERLDDAGEWAQRVAYLVADQKVVGLHHGRMEFGPRALGNRSILGDARSEKMQSIMNLKIKYRESFRPFAPSCLEERASEFFDLQRPSPYMLLVGFVKGSRLKNTKIPETLSIRDRINQVRSDIPAITHVDNSARVQTVSERSNPRFHRLLKSLEDNTGSAILINTSFNVRGEPIVCTPEDAYRCFMRTQMDYLVLGSFLLDKKEQPVWREESQWREDFVLD